MTDLSHPHLHLQLVLLKQLSESRVQDAGKRCSGRVRSGCAWQTCFLHVENGESEIVQDECRCGCGRLEEGKGKGKV